MNIQVGPTSSNLASAMLNSKIRPRAVVGYGVKNFHPSPLNYVTRGTFLESPENFSFRPEKPFVKLRPAVSVKLVFSYVGKGIKIKITAKFRASIRLRFEDTKRIMSPEIRPKSFGTFEKQAPDHLERF